MQVSKRFTDTATALDRLKRDVGVGQGARQGAAWLGSAQAAAQVLQFVFSIVNARLLLPADFGLAAAALAVVYFATSLSQFGLGAALIHEDDPDDVLASTAFWMSAATAWLLAGLMAGFAGPLSAALGNPEIRSLLFLGAGSIAVSCSVVPTALLERTFNFRFIAYANLAGAGVGLIAVPTAALAGLGPYSLMLGPFLQVLVTTGVQWVAASWRPTVPPSRRAAVHLWRYSRGIGGFNILSSISRTIDSVSLSRVVGPAVLGQYNRALNLTAAPVQQMQQAVDRSLFPALARLKHDRSRMGEAWYRGVTASGAAVLPVSVTLAATAPSLVATLYGTRWMPMVPILEILALATVPQMLTAASGAIYRASDRTGQLFRSACWSAVCTCIAVLVGSRWGAIGVATALALKYWVDVFLFVVPVFRFAPIRTAIAIRSSLTMLVPSVMLAGAELAVRLLAQGGPPQAVFVGQLAAGGAAYLVGIRWAYPSLFDRILGVASRNRG